ncbi:MAG: methylmalonyl-CoA mutase family protein [Terricaulis sp.]
MSDALKLGEAADEAAWRALVERGLKGAPWSRLVGVTADGIALEPLYREADFATAGDPVGFPDSAPFVRGAREGPWTIRQAYEHPSPEITNADILTDLAGGVGGIELVLGKDGVAIASASDLDVALANVILEAAPISLGHANVAAATLLEAKLKGVAARGTAFNLDPIGAGFRAGTFSASDMKDATGLAARVLGLLPHATSLRADARAVHEAGGSEAQEIAVALASGIAYLRALTDDDGLSVADAAQTMSFAVSVGPDVLLETAKLRALRLCWARVLEASGAADDARAAHIHAFTSRRMMTVYDAQTNILRVTTAAFAAGIGGADAITTYPFTDAIGLPTAFARRVARNTQNVLLEECRLGHVADPAGGAWFVEKLTHELAEKAWRLMRDIETKGGVVSARAYIREIVSAARAKRERAIATRKETITGVTDFPLLGARLPEVTQKRSEPADGMFAPMRWSAPFESLRAKVDESAPPSVFFATLGALANFGPRAQFARNLFAAGGVGAIGAETEYASRDEMVQALRASGAKVAVLCGADATYVDEAENAAQRLKAGGAKWVVIAGKPGDREAAFRAAGIDQFVFTGQDALAELRTLHAALGVA